MRTLLDKKLQSMIKILSLLMMNYFRKFHFWNRDLNLQKLNYKRAKLMIFNKIFMMLIIEICCHPIWIEIVL